jgi:hypothetical protein
VSHDVSAQLALGVDAAFHHRQGASQINAVLSRTVNRFHFLNDESVFLGLLPKALQSHSEERNNIARRI